MNETETEICERDGYASWAARLRREVNETCQSWTATDFRTETERFLADPGAYPCADNSGACKGFDPWTRPEWRGPDYADHIDPHGLCPVIAWTFSEGVWLGRSTNKLHDCKED